VVAVVVVAVVVVACSVGLHLLHVRGDHDSSSEVMYVIYQVDFA
jgi:hypothetical protein